ncbi:MULTISPECIES: TonB-dependent receptor [unclassified Sphingobium]|uniref:TonB-dependent receptor n=1 Tax=unclassified Sphingobium TaxID=2611147 RepID=UPI001919C000|nr:MULTISPECIES: TonB-dependent receptor [unclassified Sphingobium]
MMTSPASGQGSPESPSDTLPGSDVNSLDEIVVTANRREESLQNVPVTVSVLNSEALRRDNIVSNQDLAGKVPSLVVGQNSGSRNTQSFTLRGQGSTYGGGPGVAAYFAEVPIPSASDTVAQLGTDTLFYDLQNVQVLKGPQGTLFGRNTTGGAVLLEPQKPKNKFSGYLQGQIGNYLDRQLEGALNVPVIEDKLLVRLAGRTVNREGYTRDIITRRDYDDRKYWAFRLGVTWRPAEGVDNYFLATAFRSSTNGTGSVIQDFNTARDGTGRFLSPVARYYGEDLLRGIVDEQRRRGPRRVQLDGNPYDKRSMWMLTNILSIDLSDALKLRNITSYARYKTSTVFDLDGSYLHISTSESGPWNSTDARQLTEEIQLQGTGFDNMLNYTAGIYYEDVKPLGIEFRGTFVPVLGSITNIFSGDERKSTGVYSQGSIDLGLLSSSLDKLRLTGGARYTWDRRNSFYRFIVNGNCLLSIATPPECRVSEQIRDSALTWTAGLDYMISERSLAFAKISRGFKSGGFNFNGTNAFALTFDPEVVTTYEAGLKTQFYLGTMPVRLNSAAYYTDYKDIQRVGSTTTVTPDGNLSAGSATVNAGSATIKGIELEGSISPFKGLNLSAGYSRMHAKYDQFAFQYLLNGQVTTDDRSGVPFAFAPKNQYNIAASYAFSLGEMGNVIASASFAHIDRHYTQITIPIGQPGGTEPYGYLPASNLLNLRVDWNNLSGRPIDLAFIMTNVTNNTFPTQIQSTFGRNGASYGQGVARYLYSEPRMYGFQLRFRFGEEG